MSKVRPSYVLLALAILLVFVNPLARRAADYNQESAKVAATVHTSYRVINRLVSMVAETQVEASAVVASVTFQPGKTLQSLLDTLQRFGDIMFPLMIVSGVLGIIIVPAAKLGAGLATIGLIVHVVLGHASRISGSVRAQLQRLARGLISIGFLIALVIPGAYAVGYMFGEHITETSWNRAVTAFQSFSDAVEAEEQLVDPASNNEALIEKNTPIEAEKNVEEKGVLSDVLEGISSTADSVTDATTDALSSMVDGASNIGGQAWDLIDKIPEFASKVGELVTASFDFLIAYLIKTIVLPLLIAGLAILLWRRLEAVGQLPLESREVKQVSAAEATNVQT